MVSPHRQLPAVESRGGSSLASRRASRSYAGRRPSSGVSTFSATAARLAETGSTTRRNQLLPGFTKGEERTKPASPPRELDDVLHSGILVLNAQVVKSVRGNGDGPRD